MVDVFDKGNRLIVFVLFSSIAAHMTHLLLVLSRDAQVICFSSVSYSPVFTDGVMTYLEVTSSSIVGLGTVCTLL